MFALVGAVGTGELGENHLVRAATFSSAVGIDAERGQPMMLLREGTGARRVLPVWIGRPEAAALEVARADVTLPRPSTHELLGVLIARFGRHLDHVRITGVDQGIFCAELVFDGATRVRALASDAVILALRLDVGIEAAEEVLARAALATDQLIATTDQAAEPMAGDQARQLEVFVGSSIPPPRTTSTPTRETGRLAPAGLSLPRPASQGTHARSATPWEPPAGRPGCASQMASSPARCAGPAPLWRPGVSPSTPSQ